MAKLNVGKSTSGKQIDRHPDYFEGTLQLRNPSTELIKYVRNEIKKRKGVWIANEKKVTKDWYPAAKKANTRAIIKLTDFMLPPVLLFLKTLAIESIP